MRLIDFHYDLPAQLIARYPLASRSASRLFYLAKGYNAPVSHYTFKDFASFLSPNDLLVLNNTRVIPARLLGAKATGGRVEILVERILDQKRILAQMRSSKPLKKHSVVLLSREGEGKPIAFEFMGRNNDLFEFACHDSRPVMEVIDSIGEIPIPPYFERKPCEDDKERYQTIYADQKGSVAAPTAGLHFDHALLKELQKRAIDVAYVTHHIGAGTFASVRVDDITKHRMHFERTAVSVELCEKIKQTKARGGRVIAVGTTTVRSLETAAQNGSIQPWSGETDLFIYPGFTFQCVDVLVTNFHLPCSTLLMLVCAFGGSKRVLAAYQDAIRENYRFFSYGDAMWVEKETEDNDIILKNSGK